MLLCIKVFTFLLSVMTSCFECRQKDKKKQSGKSEVCGVVSGAMGLQCSGPRITKIILSNSTLVLTY